MTATDVSMNRYRRYAGALGMAGVMSCAVVAGKVNSQALMAASNNSEPVAAAPVAGPVIGGPGMVSPAISMRFGPLATLQAQDLPGHAQWALDLGNSLGSGGLPFVPVLSAFELRTHGAAVNELGVLLVRQSAETRFGTDPRGVDVRIDYVPLRGQVQRWSSNAVAEATPAAGPAAGRAFALPRDSWLRAHPQAQAEAVPVQAQFVAVLTGFGLRSVTPASAVRAFGVGPGDAQGFAMARAGQDQALTADRIWGQWLGDDSDDGRGVRMEASYVLVPGERVRCQWARGTWRPGDDGAGDGPALAVAPQARIALQGFQLRFREHAAPIRAFAIGRRPDGRLTLRVGDAAQAYDWSLAWCELR